MSEKQDVLDFMNGFTLKTVFDNKKAQGYVEDGAFYRALGDNDTDEYLNVIYHKEFGYYPSDASIKAINKNLTYKAKIKGIEDSVHNRVVKKDNSIYVNTGSKSIIKITAKKVDLIKKSSVKFERHSCIGKMPVPDLVNGNLNLLKKYIRVKSSNFKLILVFIFNCFFTDTHYVMLVLMGPAGSAKSFITKVLKTIIDPSVVTLRNQITKVEDLVIAAVHCHLIDMNNVSRFSDPIQDTLCTILTGGARTTRTKYSNKGQTAIHTHNPAVINGIGDNISRDDLYERSIVVGLKKMSETNIVPIGEKQLTENFIKDLPRIMGGIFNALSDILETYEDFEAPQQLNRMADFHILGLVVEKALEWEEGSFIEAYDANIADAQTDVIEGSEVAQAIINLKKHNDSCFLGTYIQLKVKLNRFGDIGNIDPRKLSSDIDRVSASLFNLHGIKITKKKRDNSGSRVEIKFN